MTAELIIRVQPRASKNEILRTGDDRLKVKVTSPPADGRANQQVVTVLADRLRIARGRVSILAGRFSRDKRVRIDGLTETQVRTLLDG